MATVVALNSPQAVLDYLNSITLPAEWEVIDAGGKFTVVSGVDNAYVVETVDGPDALQTLLDALIVPLVKVVPKKAGGKFVFYSETDVVGGAPGLSMEIVSDQASLEIFLNTAITVVDIIEHSTKKLVIWT